MNNTELKPCPFCGGEVEIRHNVIWYWVQCKKCNANAKESSNENIAIENWNTRKPMDNIVAELEEEKNYDGKFLGDCSSEVIHGVGYCKGIRKAIDIVRKGGAE